MNLRRTLESRRDVRYWSGLREADAPDQANGRAAIPSRHTPCAHALSLPLLLLPLLVLHLGGELGEDRVVDPVQPLRREGALEEAADAARARPGGRGDNLGPALAGRSHRPGGHHG